MPPRLPSLMPPDRFAVLMPVMACQLAWMPPLAPTIGTRLTNGVSTGTSDSAGRSRS